MPIFMNINFGKNGTVDSIEVDSFGFGMVNSATAGSSATGAGAGKVTFHEISITKQTDKSSPMLLIACNTGQLLPAVQFTFLDRRSQGSYLTYELKQVLVSAIHWSSGGDKITESISIAFEQFEIAYLSDGNGVTDTIQTSGQFFYPTE